MVRTFPIFSKYFDAVLKKEAEYSPETLVSTYKSHTALQRENLTYFQNIVCWLVALKQQDEETIQVLICWFCPGLCLI
jgi:hypothetical protein